MKKQVAGLCIGGVFLALVSVAGCDDDGGGGAGDGGVDAAVSSGDGAVAGSGGTAPGTDGSAGGGGTAGTGTGGAAGVASVPMATVTWAKSFGAPTIRENYAEVGADGTGNVYFFTQLGAAVDFGNGVMYTPPGTGSAFAHVLVKFNAAGVAQWLRTTGATGQNDGTADLVVDGTGNVFVLGTGRPDAGDTVYLQKWDAAGTKLWSRQMGNDLAHNPAELRLDGTGNVYAAGGMDCRDQFGGVRELTFNGAVVAGGCLLVDMVSFVVKYDSAGAFQWVLASKGNQSYATGLAVDAAGIVTVGGVMNDSVTWGTTKITHTKEGAFPSTRELYLARLDAGGTTATWGHQMADTQLGFTMGQKGTTVLLEMFISSGTPILGMTTTASGQTFVTVDPATGNATALKPWSGRAALQNGPLAVSAAGQVLRGVRGSAGSILPQTFNFGTAGGVSLPLFNTALDLVSLTSSPSPDPFALVADIAWDANGGWVATGRFNRSLMLGTTALTTTGATDDDMWLLRGGPTP